MSFVVYLLTTLLTLLTFVGERTSGTLERLLSTPVREAEIVAGYCISFSVIGMVQSSLLLMIGVFGFNILIAGNVMLAFLVVVMLAVACQSLGILLSSLASREIQAIQIFPLIAIPGFLLGGVFWPVEAIPAWLRPCSYALPITYAVDACRSVILRGWGFEKISGDLLVLCFFATIFLGFAMFTLKRRR
jgi:ABC-2 type transport system permease protein